MAEVEDDVAICDEPRNDISTLVQLKEVASGSNSKLTDSINKLFNKPGSSIVPGMQIQVVWLVK